MGLFNLLGVQITIFSQTYTVDINFIGKFIGLLVGWVGVGFGIIIFSLVLKIITLPFDVMQRITMRKQNIKMKENQERMEKLQKQYANDKEAYNQKVMEMYKENGMSMFSSCLPMILSMVIFFIAIGAFNSFSAYANVKNYNELVSAYNSAYTEMISDIDVCDYSVINVIENKEIVETEEKTVSYTFFYEVKDETTKDKLVYYTAKYEIKNLELVDFNKASPKDSIRYTYDNEGNKIVIPKDEVKAYLKDKKTEKTYYVNDAKIVAGKDGDYKTHYDAIKAIEEKLIADGVQVDNADGHWVLAVEKYFVGVAQDNVVVAYNSTVKGNTKFLWIKNVWETDAMYKHPVLKYKDFSTAISTKDGCSCSTTNKAAKIPAYTKDGYNTVTGKLTQQKADYNGYFILIALSIGTILLQQFISMRTQKEQQKYSSVDGQGAGQQKIMMVMMTGMFAIFSFMYSSAFSIYLIVSNLFSLASTLVINKIVDKTAASKEAKKAEEKFNSRYGGRVAAAEKAGKEAAKESKNKKPTDNKKKK